MSVGGGTSGLIGRFLGGAAQVAVPAALEEQRARIQTQRDAMLNSYRQGEQESAQKFQHEENQKTRDVTMNEAEKNRQQQTDLQGSSQTFQSKQLDKSLAVDKQRNDIAMKQLESTKKLQDVQTQMADLELGKAKDQDALLKLIKTEPDPANQAAMMDYYNFAYGKAQNKIAMQIEDQYGNKTDQFAIVDPVRGTVIKAAVQEARVPGDGSAAPLDADGAPTTTGKAIQGYRSKEEVRAAYRAGKFDVKGPDGKVDKAATEKKAVDLLDQFDAQGQ